jgi:opacity protein-like surface antigen
MKARFVSMLLAALTLMTGQAEAQERGPGWEIGAELIYQDTADVTVEGGSRLAFDASWGVAITAGYRFNDRLEIGFGLDWQETDYDATFQSGLLPNVQIPVSGDMEAVTPRAWLNFNIIEGPITPFVNGGIGWSFIDTNIPNSRVQVGCWWDPWWGYICTPYQSTKGIDEFTYQLGAGVRWDVSPGYTMRFAYEKHWLDYSKANGTPDFDQWKLGFVFRY